VVYADSLTAVSSDAYRFRDHPRYLADFRASIRKIAALPCDLLITPHPSASKFIEWMSGEIPLVSPGLCRAYARRGRIGLDERIDKESASS
jgi:metallo-beta-lactamase class B